MSLGKQAVSGAFWAYLEKFGIQIVSFGVSIIIARALEPKEFGLLGMLTIFMALGQTLIDSGLTQSLIRDKKPSQEDYSTVFFFNLTGSAVIYLLLYLTAPYIADFYGQPMLKAIVRVYCLSFVIGAFSAIQTTRLTKNMNFKAQMMASIPALLISSAIGIYLALNGYGVWSLVYMSLIQTTINTIWLWIQNNWTPSFIFDRKRLKYHFNFGYKLAISGVISSIFANIYPVIIGKFFPASSLGYYDRANRLRNLPLEQLTSTLNKVTYPLFATINDDDERLKRVYKQIMQTVIFFIAPAMLLLAALAEPLILFLLSDKWAPSIEYLQVLCIGGILSPFHIYNLNILKVKGRSDLFLRLEVIKRIILIITLIISIPFGIMGVIWGQIIDSVIFLFINSYYSGKMIKYTLVQQLKDIVLYIVWAALVGGIVFWLQINLSGIVPLFWQLILPGFLGLLLYFGTTWWFKVEAVKNLINLIRQR